MIDYSNRRKQHLAEMAKKDANYIAKVLEGFLPGN